MKRFFTIPGITAAAILLLTVSCRRLVFENRDECPRYLSFHIVNGEQFAPSDSLFATVYRQPEDVLVASEQTRVGDIGNFRFAVKRAESWSGYGLTGMQGSHLEGDAQWTMDLGAQSAPFYRFAYSVEEFDDSRTVPVEMMKEHANVCIRFLGFDEAPFPFEPLVRGTVCGIDGKTGKSIPGPFLYRPPEEPGATFHFRLPRQIGDGLTLELWAKNGLYIREGLIDTLNLSALLHEKGRVDWQAKNLPDIYLEIDYVTSECKIEVMDWEETSELHFEI